MFRWLRAVMMSVSGLFGRKAKKIEIKADYINAQYDEIEREHRRGLEEMVDAIASYSQLNREKESRLERLTKEIGDLQTKAQGAKGKAQKRIEEMKAKGSTEDEIKNDPEMVRCRDYFANFTSTIKAKEEEAERIEEEIEQAAATLQTQKASLERHNAELSKIREERHATIADIKMAEQEERVANQLNGITLSNSDERRQRIQDLRNQRRSRADIAVEMSGVKHKDAEEEFASFAAKDMASDSFFDDLLGTDKPVAESRLPE